jgi:Tfp pilus assembly protein PilN
MRAVNLIPIDQRSGSGPPGRSGGVAYLLLGFMALIVVMAGLYTLSARSLQSKRFELGRTEQRAQAAEAKAGSLQPYKQFATLRAQHVQTVQSLAAGRFDWAHALHELARTLPRHTWLTSLRATVAPAIQVEGGQSDPLRQSLNLPAVEILGCTTSQDGVARVMSAMRQIDGVQRVSLSTAQKVDATGGPSGSSSSGGNGASGSADCRAGSSRYPQFSMTVFFEAPAPSATDKSSTANPK